MNRYFFYYQITENLNWKLQSSKIIVFSSSAVFKTKKGYLKNFSFVPEYVNMQAKFQTKLIIVRILLLVGIRILLFVSIWIIVRILYQASIRHNKGTKAETA